MNPRTIYALLLVCAMACLSAFLLMLGYRLLDFGPWLILWLMLSVPVAVLVVSGADFAVWYVRRESEHDAVRDDAV